MVSNKKKALALGLDIGGTDIKALALADTGEVFGEFKAPSRAKEGPKAVRGVIASVVAHFQQAGAKFSSIGIGCAGSVDGHNGVVRNSPNFLGWHDVPLKQMVEEDHRLPTRVDNDANCAVFAEWRVGNGVHCRNIVLLTLGTGIGGGLVLNNALFRGSTGTGGEIGHFSIRADGVNCPCGNRGCFERYCSASALIEKSKLPPKLFFERASEPQLASILKMFLDDLKVGIISLANIFDPDVLLLGGGLSHGLAPYLSEVEAAVREHAFPAVGKHVRLSLTKHGNRSGAMGAALMSLID